MIATFKYRILPGPVGGNSESNCAAALQSIGKAARLRAHTRPMAGTADDWLCRRQALPTPDEAQRMDMVPIPEFFSDADIETLLTEVAKVQAAKAAGVLEAS